MLGIGDGALPVGYVRSYHNSAYQDHVGLVAEHQSKKLPDEEPRQEASYILRHIDIPEATLGRLAVFVTWPDHRLIAAENAVTAK